ARKGGTAFEVQAVQMGERGTQAPSRDALARSSRNAFSADRLCRWSTARFPAPRLQPGARHLDLSGGPVNVIGRQVPEQFPARRRRQPRSLPELARTRQEQRKPRTLTPRTLSREHPVSNRRKSLRFGARVR